MTSSDEGRFGALERQALDPGVLDRRQLLCGGVLEIQLQRLAEVVDRLGLAVAFAGHVDIEAARNEPVALPGRGRSSACAPPSTSLASHLW